MSPLNRFFILLVLILFVSCGSSSESADERTTITLSDMSFDPTELSALPGETIDVVNDDDVSHTVTSSSGPNAFDNSGDFDTGSISPGETVSLEIPADASLGDVFYFYCDIHEGIMDTPNGQITVQ
ncbi:MAG: cupredoxin domain-containing protein [Deltaproteobacteria bacterium]|nr:cupredoxin domain-containing protein [Deltaproteobacteria bacterium]